MIASLRGKLIHKDAQTAVVECAGVGYGVALSQASLGRLGQEGGEVFMWVHTHVSQDALRLFGFSEASERDTFLALIAVNGVGPRLALTILSHLTPAHVSQAVESGDKAALVSIAGVGKKTAERLLLELRDRLPKAAVSLSQVASTTEVRRDLMSALLNLGFSTAQAERAAKEALTGASDQSDMASLLRVALRSTHLPATAS